MTLLATCHCGATRIEVDRLPDVAGSCNCTWCERTGGLWGYYAPDEVRILAAPDRVYAPNGFNEHHFCGTCSGMVMNRGPKFTEEHMPGGRLAGQMPTETQVSLNLRMIDDDAVRALPVMAMDGRHQW